MSEFTRKSPLMKTAFAEVNTILSSMFAMTFTMMVSTRVKNV